MEPNIESTAIKYEDALERINSWAACLPGEISNLFYHIEEEEGTANAQRYNHYFYLGQDGIDHLLSFPPEDPPTVLVTMGCRRVLDIVSGEGINTFSPLLRIASAGEKHYYQLVYSPSGEEYPLSEEDGHYHRNSFIQITAEIAHLFQKNWEELNDTEVADAFSGTTFEKFQKNPSSTKENYVGPLRDRRVKAFLFPPGDVTQIIKSLHEIEERQHRYLRLSLGAGLTIRLTHPFNFRPILMVPSKTQPSLPGPTYVIESVESEKIYEAYFERSQPCPPFCEGGFPL